MPQNTVKSEKEREREIWTVIEILPLSVRFYTFILIENFDLCAICPLIFLPSFFTTNYKVKIITLTHTCQNLVKSIVF